MIDFETLTLGQFAVIFIGYIALVSTSGFPIRHFGSYVRGEDGDEVESQNARAGKIIGKCENVLILTFVLVGAYTALAVVFAAEGIVTIGSGDDGYSIRYLTGTMVNFSYSIIIAILTGLAANNIDQAVSCFA